MGHILSGLRVEKTSSGATITVSTSGTTSVATSRMSEIALKRFDELQQTHDDAGQAEAKTG